MIEFDATKAAIITIVTGLIGLIININVARAVKKCSQFGYAFGMLCLSQTISNIGNCLVFIFMAGGITLINPDWHYTYAGRRLGQLLIFFWEASIVSHLFISANRAVAVNFPTRYNRIFGDKTLTRIIVATVWLISFLQAFPYTFPVCSQQFDPTSFTLSYADGWCGELTQKYGDLAVSIVIISLISFLDITSFMRLCQLRKAHSNNRASSKEIRLFFQACVQSLVLMFCECSFFYLSPGPMVFAVFLASYLTVCVGIVGLIINVNVALAVRKCRNFGYAFGTLCLSQTISNIGNCLVFSFLTGGITLVIVVIAFSREIRRIICRVEKVAPARQLVFATSGAHTTPSRKF
ncbi:hypothetical protein QR680_007198 [Steinernema hermaphroditum]|uniref:G-protein coupled receptors family 1 profile domain-containing protein n=1 Tax=Steinernema hermaphroditum TaxID=289476 RepID=A0AA39LYF0_9BILA|nr:hypothetical protein QR680_007198 [Steinernema hermaphroditum]